MGLREPIRPNPLESAVVKYVFFNNDIHVTLLDPHISTCFACQFEISNLNDPSNEKRETIKKNYRARSRFNSPL